MRRALLVLLLLLPALGVASPAEAAGQPRGIDVSRWQHPNGAKIDWSAVRGAGASFVYIKATESTDYVNPYYADDLARSRASGMAAGAYHFARPALPLSTAVEQANAFLRAAGDQRRSRLLPPVLDLESTGGLTPGDLTLWAQYFLDEVRARTGRTPVLYSFSSFLNTSLHGPALHNAHLWVARWADAVPSPLPGDWGTHAVWQNSDSGRYPGIASAVDTNVFNGTPTDLAAFADGSAPTAWPSRVPDAPYGVSLTRRSKGTLTLRWLPGNDGGSKTSGWRATLSDGRVLNLPVTGTTTVVTGLNPALTYTLSLQAVNRTGVGAARTSNAVQPLGPTSLTLSPGSGTSGASMTASGRLVSAGAGVAGQVVQVQRQSGSTWSTVARATTASDGTWRWASTVSTNQVLRAVFPGASGYAASSTPAALRAVTPKLTWTAASHVRPGATWAVTARALPAETRVIRLLVLVNGRYVVVSSATTDSTGTVRLAWRGALAGNRTARLQVGAAPSTVGVTKRLDVVVR